VDEKVRRPELATYTLLNPGFDIQDHVLLPTLPHAERAERPVQERMDDGDDPDE